MGKEDFARLLSSIANDSDVAGRVSSNDFVDLGDGELTEAERALLAAAAGEHEGDMVTYGDDEVGGFQHFFQAADDTFPDPTRKIPAPPAPMGTKAAFGYLGITLR